MTKVINILGGPGSGKSTLSAGLFYFMKIKGYSVEIAGEFIKQPVYEENPYPFKDQLYIFAHQHKMIRELMNKVDYVICDSPLPLNLTYQTYEPPVFTDTVLAYYNQYDNTNFFLKQSTSYQQEGRLHNAEEAFDLGKRIEDDLIKYNIPYTILQRETAVARAMEFMGL